MFHTVIMAGGSGTRFWPKSTKKHPKQFLNLFGDQTMLQTTADRVKELIPAERLWVITNDRYVDLVKKQLPEVPQKNIIGEAVAKNTAPCVALAAALIQEEDPNAILAVLPADHLVRHPEEFHQVLEAANAKAREGSNLVTIGIEPNRPETGYGYIEFDAEQSGIHEEKEIRKVNQFREKPDLKTAQQFISSGNFLWNSGMFVWSSETILGEFEKHLPEISEQIDALAPAIGSKKQKEAIDQFYYACPSISIDYGIMEQSDSVYVALGSFGWSDVGSWNAVYNLREKDEKGNVIEAENISLTQSKNNLVQSNSNKMIALVGVEGLAVVETDRAILVCNLDEAQGVKQIVNQLKEEDKNKKYL